jgi:general secretion pathway protein F
VVRYVAVARFARTLATMLASGVPLLTALEIVKKVLDNVGAGEGDRGGARRHPRGRVDRHHLKKSGSSPR